jgi:hypothetical protein
MIKTVEPEGAIRPLALFAFPGRKTGWLSARAGGFLENRIFNTIEIVVDSLVSRIQTRSGL